MITSKQTRWTRRSPGRPRRRPRRGPWLTSPSTATSQKVLFSLPLLQLDFGSPSFIFIIATDLYSSSTSSSKPQRKPRSVPTHSDLPAFDDDFGSYPAHDDGFADDVLPESTVKSSVKPNTKEANEDPKGDVDMPDADQTEGNTGSKTRVRMAPRADSSTVDDLKQKAAEARKLEAKRLQEAKEREAAALTATETTEEPIKATFIAPQHLGKLACFLLNIRGHSFILPCFHSGRGRPAVAH